MWLGSKYRSFPLGIDLTKLRGCTTPVTDSKHTRTPPRHKSTARNRHFEKLFTNILTRYFTKSHFLVLKCSNSLSLNASIHFSHFFCKTTVLPLTFQNLIFTHKNILFIYAFSLCIGIASGFICWVELIYICRVR